MGNYVAHASPVAPRLRKSGDVVSPLAVVAFDAGVAERFLTLFALLAAPLSAQGETINLYGWQNHSWEFVDIDGGRSFDRIQSNAGNIGFAASMDTGMNDVKVNLQCEQFTYYNHFAGGTGWCNRNSKIGLSHPMLGEIMFATWLLPYNEGVAQWVDPFYDAGADSHTSIMGSVGAHTIFYNTGDFDFQASASSPTTGFSGNEFNYAEGGYDTGFNRRQENIIQYWSPNWNGFVFRFAWTAGNRDEMKYASTGELDPVIRSSSLAYTNGPLWLAVTWQDHEDWTAASVGQMQSSDAESFRLAGRYIFDFGDGMSLQLSAMWEDLEYEFNGVSSVEKAMSAFGYGNFMSSYAEKMYAMDAATMKAGAPTAAEVRAQKTRGLAIELATDDRGVLATFANNAISRPGPLTREIKKNGSEKMFTGMLRDSDGKPLWNHIKWTYGATGVLATSVLGVYEKYAADNYQVGRRSEGYVGDREKQTWWTELLTDTELTALQAPDPGEDGPQGHTKPVTSSADTKVYGDKAYYNALVKEATARAKKMKEDAVEKARMAKSMGSNVKIERDAWMVSGKLKFGGPLDFRFSYMDADDLEISCNYCMGDWDDTAADAWNVGLFYTMPAGTELRLTYSEVDNDMNGTYGQGISGTGLGTAGTKVEMFALGIVHWFD